MKISFKKIDITPDHKCMQAGYVQRTHSFDDVHDPLEAFVSILSFETNRIVFVMTDLIGITKEFKNEIVAKVQNEIESFDNGQLIIGASHNHSSAMLSNSRPQYMEGDKEYTGQLVQLIANTIVDLWNGEYIECSAYYSSLIVDGIYSNRNDPDKLSDKVVHIIKFEHESKPVFTLLNMSCHNTVMGPLNYSITAELFGYTRRKLEPYFQCPVCILQGNAGDMGNRQYRTGQEFEDLDKASTHLANQIRRKHSDFEKINLSDFSHHHTVYTAKFTLDPTIYDAKIARYEKLLETETDLTARKVMLSGIAGFKRKQAMGSGDRAIDMEAEIYQIGDLVIVNIPGELGSILGLRIKDACPKNRKCILWGYTNDGSLGYTVDKEAYELECQETNVTVWPAGIPELYTEAIINDLKSFVI